MAGNYLGYLFLLNDKGDIFARLNSQAPTLDAYSQSSGGSQRAHMLRRISLHVHTALTHISYDFAIAVENKSEDSISEYQTGVNSKRQNASLMYTKGSF